MTAPAARQGDAISHTDSAFGFGLGGAIGLAAGLALLTVATGGADLAVLAAIGGAVALTGGGALAGMNIGATYGSPTGDIVTGSPNVHVNAQNAARALADMAVCDEHDAPQKIATGSNSVFINGMPAARLGDVTVCDARITSASPNVFIGGGTTSYADISPEVPKLAVDIAASMVIAGSAVALGAGGAAAFASAGWAGVGVFGLQSAGGIAGSVALGQVGKTVGGALYGERGAAIGEVGLGLAGGAAGGMTGDALAGSTGLKGAAAFNSDAMAGARADQVSGGYAPDDWGMTHLKAGDTVYGGLPGQSPYYTNASTLDASGGNRDALFQSLQVAPHPEFGYRPEVGEYQVVNDADVPYGQANANTTHGDGGGNQYFIQDYGSNLQLVRKIPLGP